MFPETYSQILESSLEQTEYLGKMLDNAQLDTTNWADDTISLQMNQVAKIMKMRSELGNERDVFMLKLGGWDTHSDLKEDFNEQLTKINDALSKFHEEIKTKQGLWDNVTIVSISDFGCEVVLVLREKLAKAEGQLRHLQAGHGSGPHAAPHAVRTP